MYIHTQIHIYTKSNRHYYSYSSCMTPHHMTRNDLTFVNFHDLSPTHHVEERLWNCFFLGFLLVHLWVSSILPPLLHIRTTKHVGRTHQKSALESQLAAKFTLEKTGFEDFYQNAKWSAHILKSQLAAIITIELTSCSWLLRILLFWKPSRHIYAYS